MRSFVSAIGKVTALCAVTILTSCSGGDGQNDGTDQSPYQDITSDLAQYNRASCTFGFRDGPTAGARGKADIQNISFDKKIDRSLLEPVLGASASELIRFAETTGVLFYKTSPKSPTNCGFLHSLPPAPLDLEEEFKDANSSGGVVGLYLFSGIVGIKSTDEKAAIIARSDANKWILIHEYLHHLFHIQSSNDGHLFDTQNEYQRMTAEYKVLRKKMSKVKPKDRAKLVNKISDKLADTGDLLLILLRKYYLEEMTIETLLAKELTAGKLTQVIEEQRLNGAAYTVVSAQKAKKLLSSFDDDIEYLSQFEQATLEPTKRAKLESLTEKVNSMRQEIDSLAGQATTYLNGKIGKDYSLNGIRSAMKKVSINKNSPHGGCAHAKEADEFFSSAESL